MPEPPRATPQSIVFDAGGLVPVIVQDHLTGEVRMCAFATAEAVRRTQETGLATFWSRSRGELWEKGQTSGNRIHVVRILVDCDADCLIYSSEPRGASCHSGAESCFFRSLDGGPPGAAEEPQTLLERLEVVLEARKQSTRASSYTKSLYDGGPPALGAKLREEAAELAEAVGKESDERVVSEAADVLYHLLAALRYRGIALRPVLAELARRFGRTGHEEKAAR